MSNLSRPVIEPGIYFGLDENLYHAAEGLSCSGIKHLTVSKLNYWHRNLNPDREPEEDTGARRFGKAVHSFALEPERFARNFTMKLSPDDFPGALVTADDMKVFLETNGLPKSAKKKSDLAERIVASGLPAMIWDHELEKLGITSASGMDKLGATTRLGKTKELADDLNGYYVSRLTAEERQQLAGLEGKPSYVSSDEKAVRFAIGHEFERRSVIEERKLYETAIRQGIGSVTVEGVKAEAQNQGVLLRGSEATTKDVLAEEGRIIAFAREGRGTCRPLIRDAGSDGRSLEAQPDRERPLRIGAGLAPDGASHAQPVASGLRVHSASSEIRSAHAPNRGDLSDAHTDTLPSFDQPETSVPANMTRLYHGAATAEPITESRWFSSDRRYAEGYAEKSGGKDGVVFYVDLPTDHPLIEPEYPEQSIARGFHRNLALPDDLSRQARLLLGQQKGRPDESKRPLVRAGAVTPDNATLSPEQQAASKGSGGNLSLPPGGVKDDLSPDQLRIARHVWDSTDRVILIRGAAGTGKTHTMKATIAGIDAPVAVLAPTAEASRGVLRREGFEQADTVAAFLGNPVWQNRVKGGVIFVDEAGLLPIRDLSRLTDVARLQDARIILQGDPKQHKAVPRHGNMFNVLQEFAGLPVAELRDIRRQRGKYKELVDAQRAGELLQDQPAMRCQVEPGDAPAQAIVDEALGEFQAEVAPHGGEGAFDVQAVPEDAVEDRIPDALVVVGLGRDIQRPGAERLAAVTACLVLGVVDVEPRLLAVGQGADTTMEGALAAAAPAAVGAGVALGGAADDANSRHEHGLCSWEARR